MKNVSFHAIDLSTMFDHDDFNLKQLLQTSLDSNEIKPLPYKIYGKEDIEHGLRYMSNGKHIGKIIIAMNTDMTFDKLNIIDHMILDGTHIIIGGLGSFGLELALRLIHNGAKKIVATSRNGIVTGWQKYRSELISEDKLIIENLDVSQIDECHTLINKYVNIRGIWHTAMVLHDTLFNNMTEDLWNDVVDIKMVGLENLDQFTEHLNLDYFVCFSSISVYGNIGQTNYSYANNAMGNIILRRNTRNLKGLAIQWGCIDNVGIFISNDRSLDVEQYFALQNVDISLDSLNYLINYNGVVSSYRINETNDLELETTQLDINTIKQKLSAILGLLITDFDENTQITNYGLDSLSTIEFISWINKYTTKQITVGAFYDNKFSINTLLCYINN